MDLISLGFVFLFLFLIKYYSSIWRKFEAQYDKKISSHTHKLPPGPKPWPVVGSLPEMLFNKKPTFRWINDLMKQLDTDIACIRLGNVHVIPVKSQEIAREFLKKHDSSFASRPFTLATEYSSRGYLTTAVVPQGEQWKKMKRLMSAHIINPSKLQWLRGRTDEEADNLVRHVYNQCCNDSRSVVDLRLVTRQFCGNVMRKVLFNKRYFGEGREDGGPGVEEIEHVESAFTVLAHLYAFSPSDYLPGLKFLDLDGHGSIVRENMKNIFKYQDPIIDERIKLWRDGERTEADDMLDLFILAQDSNGQSLSPDEIKAQCAELVLAGVDNPSNAVEWTIAEMINQSEILRKAAEEIDRVVGKERLVQESDIPNLRYIRACAREAFRLHPIGPFNLPHVSNADVVVSDYFIPKGSHVLLSRYELGRNPKVWEEPLQYNPDRHLKDEKVEVKIAEPDLKFISFSIGRRGCIGVALGSTMTYMLLARLVQAFSWDVPPGKGRIDLTESRDDLFLNQPLHVLARPRLSAEVYSS